MHWDIPKKLFAALSGTERKTLVGLTAVGLMIAVVLGYLIVTKATTVAPASGGDFTEGAVGQPVFVNPVLADTPVDQALTRLVFSNVASLADDITSADGGRTWDVRLKENIRWQDGEKVTSDDIIFTVQKIEEAGTNSPLAPSWQGVLPERVSELEVKFTLAAPYAFFKDNLRNLYVLPKHLYADVPTPNWRLSDYNLKPVGSGPYAFSSYEKQSDGFITSYLLTANPTYFGDKTFIKTIAFDFYKGKPDLLRAFNGGQIDDMSVALEDIPSIERPYSLTAYPSPNYYAVFWNQTRNLALGDANVRAALAEAVDRAKLASDILGANGSPAWGPLPPDFVAPTATQMTAQFSPDDASSTLTKAGWIYSADDGVREKTINKQKVSLAFALTVPDIEFLKKTANELRSAWAAVGAKVDINIEAPELVRDSAIKNRNYDALLFGNLLGGDYDLFSFWHSSERFAPGLNLALYSNPRADGLIESIRGNPSSSVRMLEFASLENTITNDYPAVFLYWTQYLYATGKDVKGIETAPLVNPADRFLGIAKWYTKTARVLK